MLWYNQNMDKPYIINTHSHANMLRDTNIDEAISNAQNENIITIVPSSTAEDIFEVDKFIQKYDDVYGYVGVFPEEAKTFTDKTLNDIAEIIAEHLTVSESVFIRWYTDQFRIQFENNLKKRSCKND